MITCKYIQYMFWKYFKQQLLLISILSDYSKHLQLTED